MCQLISSRMKVDKRSIQVFLWKTIKLSMVTLCKFAKEYPYASVVFFIFLLLYLYVPLVFYTLVFSSPILICAAVFICFYRANLRKKHGKKEEEEEKAIVKIEEEEKKSKVKDMLVTKSEKGLRAQKSVRRNRRNENIELDTQVNKLERRRDRLISTSPFDGFINGDDLVGEELRLLAEEEIISGHEQSCKDHNPDPATCEISTGQPVEIPNIIEDQKESVESSDDEEEPSGVKHSSKAVAWTKDDERNLLDLGLSELERNKRLESLMARRRASKLFRLAVEKTLMGHESIHPIHISTARISPFDGSSYDNGVVPHMPGSAPSVLLQGRNPFDLPYDPQEERPILTEDEFHKEYSVANLKDMLLCRHESFLRCGSCHRQDSPSSNRATASFLDKRVLTEPEHGRDKRLEVLNSEEEAKMEAENDDENEPEIQLESMDNGQEELETQTNNEAIERAETETESILHDNGSCSSSSSSSSSSDSDESSMLLNERKKFPQILTDHVQKVLSLSTPPKSAAMNRSLQDWSPVAIERNRAEDHMFFKNRGSWHNQTQSIASDLQVEFSDIGSPPLTVDETASHTDEISQICDEDIEREIIHQRDTWEARNGSKSNQQDEINKEDGAGAKSSSVNEKHEQVAAENSHGTSLPSAASNTTEDDQSHPSSIINQANQDPNQDDPRPDLDTGGLHSVPETDPSNVPHGTVIEQRSASSPSSTSPTSVLLNDVLSRQTSENNLEEPTQVDVMDSDIENLSQSNLTNEESDHRHLRLREQQDALHQTTNSESQSKTRGESGENLSRAAEENSRSNEKEISSQQVIHEDNAIIDDKGEQISESGKVNIEIVADINAYETEEERTTRPKEQQQEVGVSEKAGQGIQSHQVEQLAEQFNTAADGIDSRQELENPVSNEDGTDQLKQQEAETSADKSIDDVNSIEQSK